MRLVLVHPCGKVRWLHNLPVLSLGSCILAQYGPAAHFEHELAHEAHHGELESEGGHSDAHH